MIIYLTRHGQTRLNHEHLMQGRTDEPLNETGREQARRMRQILAQARSGLHFDAVYASTLDRAIETGSIIGGVPKEEVITDARLIETDFGRYEMKKYYALGPFMTVYWRFPELFKAPPRTVESTASMIARSRSFLMELEMKDLSSVLIAAHGGILRALCGYLDDRKNGLNWRPKPTNCEVRVYESKDGRHRFLEKFLL